MGSAFSYCQLESIWFTQLWDKEASSKKHAVHKNETQTAGTACKFVMMSKYTDSSKRFKHMKSDFYADGLNVKDCKGRSVVECATRDGNTRSKLWGAHSILVRWKAFDSHNFEIKKLWAKNMVHIKNETQTAGTACYLTMFKHTDASKR